MKAGHRLEGERARRDGRIFAYAFNPLPEGGGVLTFSDVTEARKREARLARSEEGFRYRFRNLPLPVWTYSAKTLKFLDVNDAAIAEYGYTREEFLSMSAIDICGPEGAERLSKWLAEGGVRRPSSRTSGTIAARMAASSRSNPTVATSTSTASRHVSPSSSTSRRARRPSG